MPMPLPESEPSQSGSRGRSTLNAGPGAIARLFWPQGLLEELRLEGTQQALLFGLRALPTGPSASFVNLVVIGTASTGAPVAGSIARLNAALAQLPAPPPLAGWPTQLCCLGCWAADEAGAYQGEDVSATPVWLTTCSLAARSSSSRADLPCLLLDRCRVGSAAHWQVFSYPLPTPGQSHLPGPHSSSSSSSRGLVQMAAQWPWLRPPPGVPSLEAAAYCCNHARYIRSQLLAGGLQHTIQQDAPPSAAASAPAAGGGSLNQHGVRQRRRQRLEQGQEQQQQQQPQQQGGGAYAKSQHNQHVQGQQQQQQQCGSRPWHRLRALLGRTATAKALLACFRSWQAAAAAPCPSAYPSTQALNQALLAQQQLLVSQVVQLLAGLGAAALLLAHQQQVEAHVAGVAAQLYQQCAVMVEWLMGGAPGGIKLHRELSFLLGTATQLLMAACQSITAALWPQLAPLLCWLVAAVCGAAGLVPGMSLVSDLLLLGGWPVVLLYVGLAGLYRLQLRYLRYTWCLMRGTYQTQTRRKPAATAAAVQEGSATATAAGNGGEVMMDRLIVGVLLFTPLLALLPTTAVWYGYAALLQLVLLACRAAITATSRLLQRNPLFLVCRRVTCPSLFPGALHVSPVKDHHLAVTHAGDSGVARVPAAAANVCGYVLSAAAASYWEVLQQSSGCSGGGRVGPQQSTDIPRKQQQQQLGQGIRGWLVSLLTGQIGGQGTTQLEA